MRQVHRRWHVNLTDEVWFRESALSQPKWVQPARSTIRRTGRRHRIAVARAAKSFLHAALNSTMKLDWP